MTDDPAAELAEAMASGVELDLHGATLPAAVVAEVLPASPPGARRRCGCAARTSRACSG